MGTIPRRDRQHSRCTFSPLRWRNRCDLKPVIIPAVNGPTRKTAGTGFRLRSMRIACQMLRFLRHHGEVEQAFDLVFPPSSDACCRGVEEFEAIGLRAVVRSADDHAESRTPGFASYTRCPASQRPINITRRPRPHPASKADSNIIRIPRVLLADQHRSADGSQHSIGGARRRRANPRSWGLTDPAAHAIVPKYRVQLSIPSGRHSPCYFSARRGDLVGCERSALPLSRPLPPVPNRRTAFIDGSAEDSPMKLLRDTRPARRT